VPAGPIPLAEKKGGYSQISQSPLHALSHVSTSSTAFSANP